MNRLFFLLLTLFNLSYSQNKDELNLVPNLELEIYNNSIKNTFNPKEIDYDDIPLYLDFRGIVVESIKWKDSLGDNILILTQTGEFASKEYNSSKTDYSLQSKAELFAYLFVKSDSKEKYKLKWKVYDFQECFIVDLYAGFIKKALTITDLDNDNIAEVTLPYTLYCRGDISPSQMKIIMYENTQKYALRGKTEINFLDRSGKRIQYGGEFSIDENLINQPLFKTFLEKKWNQHKIEKLN